VGGVSIAGLAVAAVSAYMFGSIPTGFLFGKARGIDIRSQGSGNIGATNVLRLLGVRAGITVLLIDAAKGALAVIVSRWMATQFEPGGGASAREVYSIVGALAAVMGHNYTCWLRFKGGKGIATSAGVLGALVPLALVIGVVVFAVTVAATRFVSLGSILGSAALPFAAWATGESLNMILVTGGMAALAIVKHRSNIRRLLEGTESRLGSGKIKK
jgi:glycerol-3-phosphate acyltransferase PlsY